MLTAGLKSGKFAQGFYNANPYNYLEGTVRVAGLHKPVLLIGRKAMNRSVDGDVVVVEILPKAEWRAPSGEVLDQEGELGLACSLNDLRQFSCEQWRSKTTMRMTKTGV